MNDVSTLPLSPIERPRCPRCQMRMVVARVEARDNGSEKRTFECLKCKFIETKFADDPMRSAAILRLADHLKPPG
jgi:hypothetical protein